MSLEEANVTETSAPEMTDAVIAEVVQRAALQVEGVRGFSARFYDDVAWGLSERIGRFPGVTIKRKKTGLAIHLYLITSLERSLIALAQDVQCTVATSLRLRLHVVPAFVNVKIEGISVDSEGDTLHDGNS